MFQSSTVLMSIKHEIKVIKHLGSKVKSEHLNYRPHEKQRSVLELLQYLSHAGFTSVEYIKSGNWSHAKKNSEEASKVNLSNFSKAMDDQMEKIEKFVIEIGEAKLSELNVNLPSGSTVKGDVALMEMPLKFLVGYRMQLFLYLKACGLQELSTSNCWGGMDPKPKA